MGGTGSQAARPWIPGPLGCFGPQVLQDMVIALATGVVDPGDYASVTINLEEENAAYSWRATPRTRERW